MNDPKNMPAMPMDAHNKKLLANVHPDNWTNPEPVGIYNLVVIGAGTAGLVSAAGAAGLGAKVAIIEKQFFGGDCLNVGCVPSKSLIRSSRTIADVKDAERFGVKVPVGTEVQFGAVMERLRSIRADISPHDSAERFKNLGVDVFIGDASFIDGKSIKVGGKTLKFKKAVIASGARAADPEIPGLKETGFLTNETVFNLTDLPKRLACIGGGPIGCELAQAFQRLGSQVTLFHTGSHLLNREDPDAAAIIQKKLVQEGIRLVLNAKISKVTAENGAKTVHFNSGGAGDSVSVDEILAGAGRTPNVEGLNLEAAEVKYNLKTGVEVNDFLQTSNPDIFAAGDVCMNWKFTHAADAAARIVIQNALFLKCKKLSDLVMPWCTFTDPEIAHVGIYEKEAKEKGIETQTFLREMKDVDRAKTDGEEEGFVKVLVQKGTDKILGATIVARHAGEMINELTLAITGNIGLGRIGGVIHPYPTQSEAVKQTADAFNRTRLTPGIKKLFSGWLAWKRR